MNCDDPPSPAPRRHLLLLTLVAAALVAVLGFGEVAPSVAIVSSVPVADESSAASRASVREATRQVSRRRCSLSPRPGGRRGARRSSFPVGASLHRTVRWLNPPLRGPPFRRAAIGVAA